MRFRCLFGHHGRNATCHCTRCGKISHRFVVVEVRTEDTGNFETSTEPWLSERAITTTSRCTRCDEESQSVRVEWYLG